MDSLKGQLLLAGARVFDPNFRRMVVLIVEHDVEGAVGVVLNDPAGVRVGDAVPGLEEVIPDLGEMFIGGPVEQDSVVILAELGSPRGDVQEVFGSVFVLGEGWVEGSPADRPPVVRARAFTGYSGWGSGQLELEMAELDWIVEPATADDVFATAPDDLWSNVLNRKGGRYQMLAAMPIDPSAN